MTFRAFSCVAASLLWWGPAQTAQLPANSQQIQSHLRQAQEDLAHNKPDLAIDEFKAVLALDPNELTAQANLGTLLYFRGDYQNAAANLRSFVKSQPSLWKTVMLLGMCEKRLGNGAAARADLESAFPQLTEEKLRVQAGMELTELYYASRDLEKAADLIAVLKKLQPDDPAILYTAHRIYSEQAQESALSIALLAPHSAWMHEIMAEEMMIQGDNDAAIAHYRSALKIDDRLPGLHFDLAELLNSALSPNTDKAQAEKEYQAALAQNPFDEKSECRLGRIALGRSDANGALAHYARAIDLQSEDPEANLGFGKVLLSLHRPQQAEPVLEKAVRLDPSDPAAHYLLGTLYRQLDRPGYARRELAEFQRLKQTKEQLKEIYKQMRIHPTLGANETDLPQ